MSWTVVFADAFEPEFGALPEVVQDKLPARLEVLAHHGPALGRPYVDTLKGSAFTNMKELRFAAANGVWRVAFAFDPDSMAVVLVAGDRRGTNESRFYARLIDAADRRFRDHLERRA